MKLKEHTRSWQFILAYATMNVSQPKKPIYPISFFARLIGYFAFLPFESKVSRAHLYAKIKREAHIVHKRCHVNRLRWHSRFLLHATHPYVQRILKMQKKRLAAYFCRTRRYVPFQNCVQALNRMRRTGRHDGPINTYRPFHGEWAARLTPGDWVFMRIVGRR